MMAMPKAMRLIRRMGSRASRVLSPRTVEVGAAVMAPFLARNGGAGWLPPLLYQRRPYDGSAAQGAGLRVDRISELAVLDLVHGDGHRLLAVTVIIAVEGPG